MTITFYSTHCPKCKVIETKLKATGLKYTEVNDTAIMLQLGYRTAPILKVDDKVMDFSAANKYLNSILKEAKNGVN